MKLKVIICCNQDLYFHAITSVEKFSCCTFLLYFSINRFEGMLYKELAFAEILMEKYSLLSTHEGLVDLATKLDVQIQSLEVA